MKSLTTTRATIDPATASIPELWAPLRAALIAQKGRDGAADFMQFAIDTFRAEHRIAMAIAANKAAAGIGSTYS